MDKRIIIIIALVIGSLFILSNAVRAVPTHLDKTKVQTGCRTCHKAHGVRGTVLLEMTKEELCFKCHPLSSRRDHPIISRHQ